MSTRRFWFCAALAVLVAAGCGTPAEQVAGPATATAAQALAAQQATAAAKPARGEAKAVMVDKGPAVDGTLNSPLWQKATVLELRHATSDKPAGLATTARMLFDPTDLYLAVECADPDTDAIKKAVTQRDGPVYTDDSIEFFVSGDPRDAYYQFCINAAGTVMDGKFKAGQHVNKSWNCNVEVKTSIEKNKRWIVTARFPLKELSAYVGTDQMWVVNVNRNTKPRGGKRLAALSWSLMEKTDWHAVNDYGSIDGVNVPKRPDGVTRTVAPMPKPPKYLQGVEVGGVRVYTGVASIEAPDKGKGTQYGMPLPIKGSRGLKLAFLGRGTNGVSSVPLNVMDARARDNTTPISYYWVDEQWRPILYRFSEFRYNAVVESRVAPAADFRSIFFHGNRTGGKGVLSMKGLVVYRGDDRTPPEAPTGLKTKGNLLTWEPAKDNVGVARYAVSYEVKPGTFEKVDETAEPLYRAIGPPARYRVLAVDFEENVGPWSKPAEVTVGIAAMKFRSQPEKDRVGYAEHVAKVHAAGVGKVKKGRVLCYGDSLTGATNYRHYVAAALGNYEVIACGYPAMRTSFGKTHIERHMKQYKPEFCLILYGTNNSKGEKNIPPAIDDMMFIAKTCEKYGTVPVIGTIPPRGFRDPESKPEARYNAALIAACRKNGVPIAYIFEEYQGCGVDRKKLLASDGVHTVSAGWVCMGKAWRAAMEQVRFVIFDRP